MLQNKNKNPQEVKEKADFITRNNRGPAPNLERKIIQSHQKRRGSHRSQKIKKEKLKRKIKQGKKQNKSIKKTKKQLQVIPLVPQKDNQNGRHLQLKSIAMRMRKSLSQKSQ